MQLSLMVKIICYNTPLPEMQGNIVYVDYERSSWKYMSYERNYGPVKIYAQNCLQAPAE